MSTIPLSMREGHGQTTSGGDMSDVVRDDDSALDALIDNVTETIIHRGAAGHARDEVLLDAADVGADGSNHRLASGDSWRDLKAKLDDPDSVAERGRPSDLDRALKLAVDRRAGQEVESADFHQSRQWRTELDRRYDGRVAIGDVLDSFADWHERLKQDPKRAAEAIASAYLAEAPYAVLQDVRQSGKPAQADRADGAVSDQKLDGVLTAAIDQHHGKGDGEQKAFVASARHRAALKEMFPGMSYAEACRRMVALDGDLHRDPMGAAGRLAATYGMVVMPAQQVVADERNVLMGDAQQMIAATGPHMPDLVDLQDEVITVLGRPDFVHGPDMQENLVRAHRIAQAARDEQQRLHAGRTAAKARQTSRLDGLIARAMQGAGSA